MSTIVYLSNQLVQAVEFRGSTPVSVCQGMAPEGSIINGVVTDVDVFIDFIKRFFIKNKLPRKECTLVVSSSQITTRMLELPKANYVDLNKMIAREFSDNSTDNMLYVYHVMGSETPGRMQKLLAAAVDKSFVQSYIQLFNQAGIEIIAIEPAIINFAKRIMDENIIKGQNCIVQIHDGLEVVSILFADGCYLFSQRNRVFAGDSEEALAKESESLVRGLLQFAVSQKLEKPVDKLFVCGKNQQNLISAMMASEDFSGQIQIAPYRDRTEKIKVKPTSDNDVEYVYALENEKPDKYLNFIWKMHEDSEENQKRKETFAMALPAIVVSAVCLVITAFLTFSYFSKRAELTSMQNRIQESDSMNTSYDLMEANVVRMQKQVKDTELFWKQLLSYPTVNTTLDNMFKECAGRDVTVQMKDFDRDTGVITLNATAKDARKISEFVGRLQELPELETIEYSGYTYTKSQNSYSIHVVCALSEQAGR